MKKKLLVLLTVFMLILCSSFALAGTAFAAPSDLAKFVDGALLLNEDEAVKLEGILNEYSVQRDMDIVIITLDGLDGMTAQAAADDLYDYLGYGAGEGDDGVLFLIDIESRTWAISTYGRAIPIFSDADQADIMDRVLPYLSSGDYYSGFETFAERSNWLIDAVENPVPEKDPGIASWIPIALIIGIAVGAVFTFREKGKLKSVSMERAARNYMAEDGVNITDRKDIFLYNHVTKTPIPKNDDNNNKPKGGVSTTHVSSSGRTHGGSSGSF